MRPIDSNLNPRIRAESAFGLREFLLATIGIGAFLGGIAPMFMALTVSNEVIDRGATNASTIIALWHSWAFTWNNLGLIIVGCVLIGFVIKLHRDKRLVLTVPQ